jgi:hypothetical protein
MYDVRIAQSAQEALTTAEELLLLAIDTKSGALHSQPRFRLSAALAGAVLLDLFADGSLTLVDDKVTASAGDGGNHYPVAFERIRSSPIPRGLAWWIDVFGFAGKEAKAWPIASLADQRVIEVQKRPWLPPFPQTRYRLIDPSVRARLAIKVLDTLRSESHPDPQSIAIAVLAAECGVVKSLAPRSQRHAIGQRILALVQGQVPSPDHALTKEQHPTLIAQVYAAVNRQGLAGVVQGTQSSPARRMAVPLRRLDVRGLRAPVS